MHKIMDPGTALDQNPAVAYPGISNSGKSIQLFMSNGQQTPT